MSGEEEQGGKRETWTPDGARASSEGHAPLSVSSKKRQAKRKSAKPGASDGGNADRALKGKRLLFVQEYLVDLNATQAAIRAGYSPRTAGQFGFDLLKNHEIQAAIQSAMAERAERTKVTADRVIQELGFVALSDIGEVLNVDPSGLITVRSLDDLTPSARRCIKSIKQTTHQYVVGRGEAAQEMEKVILQVELHPKVQALDLLMDHHGLKKPVKHEHAGEGGGPIQTAVRYVVSYPEEEPEDVQAPAEAPVH